MGYSHTDVVRIFQSLSVNDLIRLTVCRGYPLAVNFDDPQIDVVSLNGVHNSIRIIYLMVVIQNINRIFMKMHLHVYIQLKFEKVIMVLVLLLLIVHLDNELKLLLIDNVVKILCENDLLLSINGQDLAGKQHADVVDILVKCSKDIETIIRYTKR